jgi:hypothetical protein
MKKILSLVVMKTFLDFDGKKVDETFSHPSYWKKHWSSDYAIKGVIKRTGA